METVHRLSAPDATQLGSGAFLGKGPLWVIGFLLLLICYYVVRNAKLAIFFYMAKYSSIKISELAQALSQLAFMLRG